MNEIIIPVKKPELFYQYLTYINPLLNLKDRERQVLGALISLKYTYKDRYLPKQLDEFIFSESTYNQLAKRYDSTPKAIEKNIEALKEKHCILKDPKSDRVIIHPNRLKFYQEDKFKLTLTFVIKKEDEKESKEERKVSL